MKSLFTFLFLTAGLFVQAQVKIEGTVLNKKNQPMAGVNIYVDGTYDGATTGDDGKFSFETAETGAQVLVFTALFHEDLRKNIVVEDYLPQLFALKESVNVLDAVVISAGAFQAGDNSKVTALKPLDIVTTAGAAGDIVGALLTLPARRQWARAEGCL